MKSTDDRRTQVSGIRHKYRELTTEEKQAVDYFKDKAQEFWDACDRWQQLSERPGSARSFALAKTKIEEAVFWAVHGVTNPESNE